MNDLLSLRIMTVNGSLHQQSVTAVVLQQVSKLLSEGGCQVDELDFRKEPLPLFNPETAYQAPYYDELKMRVERADVFVHGTPDYHGGISSTLKNFLDHFWSEFAGKLFVAIVASYEKGLTASDQLRTVARQCYAWSLPYSLSFAEGVDVKDGQVASKELGERLAMLARDARVYGDLMARQRRIDLAGSEACFLARQRQ